MATSMVEKLLSDAKLLTNRLKERDTLANTIISTTRGVHQKLQAIQQYQGQVEKLNKAASHRPKIMLIQRLNKMNCQIDDLNKDNSDLRQSLEDHQEILELIMNKYREQTDKLDSTFQLEATPASNSYAKDLEVKESKIQEMVSVIMVASGNWEEKIEVTNERRRLISILQQNNRMMRMVLLNTTEDILKSESNALEDNLINDFKNSIDINNKYDTTNINNTNNNNSLKNDTNIMSETTIASSFSALSTDSDDKIHKSLDLFDITLTTPFNQEEDNNNDENCDNSNQLLYDTLTNTTSPSKTLKSQQESLKVDKMAEIKPQVYIYSDDDFTEDTNSETETLCDETLTRTPDFNVSLVTLS